MYDFTPSTVPGCRTPHVWLRDGRSLYDAMGPGFTLLRFDRTVAVDALVGAATQRSVPLAVLDVDASTRPIAHKLVLSRPDQHVAWRGNAQPDDAMALIDLIRGPQRSVRHHLPREQRQALRHIVVRHRPKPELHDHAADADRVDLRQCSPPRSPASRRSANVPPPCVPAGAAPGAGIGTIDTPCSSYTRLTHRRALFVHRLERRNRNAFGLGVGLGDEHVAPDPALRRRCAPPPRRRMPCSRSVRRYRSMRCRVTSFDCTFIMNGRPCRAMCSIPSSLEAERIT